MIRNHISLENRFKKTIEGIASDLKAEGFKRNRTTWNRSNEQVVEVFEVRLSRCNDASNLDFTFNIGGVSRFVWETCWGKTLPKHVNSEECFPVFRVGEIIGNFACDSYDKWWSLSGSDDENSVASLQDEVSETVRGDCLPLLTNMSTEEGLLTECSRLSEPAKKQPANQLCYAILLARTGRISEARATLTESSVRRLNAWQSRANAVADRLGIGTE